VTDVEHRSADTTSRGHVVEWNTEWKVARAVLSHWVNITVYVS
jgi:hypothetical protein